MDEKSNLLIKKFLPMKNLLLSLAAALCCIATINAQVAVTVGGGSWCSEVSWSLTDASGAEVGECCIINSKSCIEHNVKIGKFCHISTGALINGGVKIGGHSFIGSGAIIREKIEIPRNTILGAGKIVLHWPQR